ncbi:MAG: hypothetical protein HYZ27_07960, partial [Deltaproteobacteria bacterium]|nr:hypothetical protein [Deltaproteobacteria bacterium]
QVLAAGGKGYLTRVLTRNRDLGVAILYMEDDKADHAKIGAAAELTEGAPLVAQVFNAKGEPALVRATFNGWRYHRGHAYLETNADTGDDAAGAGFFGPDGKLIGVQSFKLAPKLTYLLPIEYVTHGTASITKGFLGERKESDTFARTRTEAKKHTEPLPAPLTFETIAYKQAFSRTALIGLLVLLDKKDTPAHAQPIKYKLEAIDAERNRRVIAEGTIDAANVRWFSAPELVKEVSAEMTASFGADWVAKNLAPYDYGELRYRIPFAPFCGKVTDTEVHALTLILADGRSSGEMGFSDLINICAAQEEGEGTAMEAAWGMQAAPEPAPKAAKKRRRR